MQIGVESGIGSAKFSPLSLIRSWQPGINRRQRGIWQLQRVAGDDPHPGHAGGEHRRKGDDIVLDDDIRLDF